MTSHDLPEVEVINKDDVWSAFGNPLPDPDSSELAESKESSNKAELRWPIWSVGAFFTVTLHTLLLCALTLGSPARKYQKPMTERASTSAMDATQGEFVSQLILINDHAISTEDQADPSYVSVESKQVTRQQPFVEVAAASQPEVAGSESGTDSLSPNREATGDGNGRAMLFGRYMGQIKARIERAWVYPSSTSLHSFQCRVQIRQTRNGDVQEVMLLRCNADPAWQISLVKAIQAASPLSAPPDDTVFSQVITLSFDATLH